MFKKSGLIIDHHTYHGNLWDPRPRPYAGRTVPPSVSPAWRDTEPEVQLESGCPHMRHFPVSELTTIIQALSLSRRRSVNSQIRVLLVPVGNARKWITKISICATIRHQEVIQSRVERKPIVID